MDASSEGGDKGVRRGGIRVLVAVDLLDSEDAAVRVAYSLVRGGGELQLVYVERPLAMPSPLYAHYAPGPFPTGSSREERRLEAKRQLEARFEALAVEGKVLTGAHVVESESVGGAVSELAETLGVDVVCVLARHKVAPGRCGRQVRRLLASCAKPLLVVRPGHREGDGAAPRAQPAPG